MTAYLDLLRLSAGSVALIIAVITICTQALNVVTKNPKQRLKTE